jgi:CRISP-associated protein Cas1
MGRTFSKNLHAMTSPSFKTARALHPDDRDLIEWRHLYEPLPVPQLHPELDLWGQARVALAQTTAEPTTALRHAIDTPASPTHEPSTENAEPIPARMLNEFVYCPRLFHYEYVQGVFMKNADTERGEALHEKVDRGKGSLPRANKKKKEQDDLALLSAADQAATDLSKDSTPVEEVASGESDETPTDTIHSRSASLSSDRLGVIAKMDLIEVKVSARAADDLFSARVVQSVTPVDYKAGAPRQSEHGNEIWDADKMQLGLQILILRDNGYACDEGVIYYRATKQRVRLPMTLDLENWIIENIAAARSTAASLTIPPPLAHSPKCVRCSLAPVCLPDETRMLAETRVNHTPAAPASSSPRRLIAARDDARALYLSTQGYRVGIKSEVLVIKDGDRVVDEIRLLDVSQVSVFGNIQLSTQALHTLCHKEIPIAWFSMSGWFYGTTLGHGLKNVQTRIAQFSTVANPLRSLEVAQNIVRGKIRNQRTILTRNHEELPTAVKVQLDEIESRISGARGLDELLGMEGAAAATYFQNFSGLIKVGKDEIDDELPGLESEDTTRRQEAESAAFNFDFTKRTRRPATDPVNAMLSYAYSILAKDCAIACLMVGLDPYVGFYHQPRHGRPALALDLMEEFRPLIADSAVITAINNRVVNPSHFVRAGDSVALTSHGRKAFIHAYEQRMSGMITHPVFGYKVNYRRVIELQARLLARWLTGEIPDYIPMKTR